MLTERGHPEDYCASFVQLADLGILRRDCGRRGQHRSIVHEYDDLDPRKLHEALQTALADAPAYLRQVNAFLDRSPS